ncbi:hypothetical protein EPN52_01730 [bacterium]|nr:MAG: hypothetical protein EPN52_01730 [bacterium]
MRALVLSGGGAAGAYQAGVVAALTRRATYDIVCGTSIGAINGALVAQGKIDEMAGIWHAIASKRIIRYVPQVQRLLQLIGDVEALNNDPLYMRPADLLRLITRYLELGPPSAIYRQMGTLAREPVIEALAGAMDFASLRHTLVVSATNVSHAASECFYAFVGTHAGYERAFCQKRKGACYQLDGVNFFPAVLASSATPGAFEPMVIETGGERCLYVDGGVANNSPIGLAIDAGASDVTVVAMEPADDHRPREIPVSMAELALVTYDVFQDRMLTLDLKLAQMVNEAIRADSVRGKRVVSLHTVRPTQRLGLPILGFNDQAAIDAAFEQGLRDGEAAEIG